MKGPGRRRGLSVSRETSASALASSAGGWKSMWLQQTEGAGLELLSGDGILLSGAAHAVVEAIANMDATP